MKINHSFLSSASSSTRLTKKTQIWLLAGIVTLALIFRLIFLYAFHDDYFQAGVIVANGELARQVVSNHRLAMNAKYMKEVQTRQIAEGKLIDVKDWPVESGGTRVRPPSVSDTPGYSVLLALTWWVFGTNSYFYLQIIQVILDALFCLVVFWVGKRLFSVPVGLVAAMLFALYIPEARLAVNAHRDIWANFFTFGSVAFFYLVVFKQKWQKAHVFVFYGAIFALISWIRPTIVLFPLIAIPFFISHLSWRKTFIYTGITYFMLLFIFFLPFLYYNHSKYQRLFTSSVPLLIWNGIVEDENNWEFRSYDDLATKYVQEAKNLPLEPYQPEFQEYIGSMAKERIMQGPGRYLISVMKRIPRLLTLKNIRGDFHRLFKADDTLWTGKSDSLRKLFTSPPAAFLGKSINKVISTLTSGEVLFLFFVTGLFIFRKRVKLLSPLILTVLYFAFVFSPFLTQGRFVLPMVISYFILFAASLIWLMNRAKIIFYREKDAS